MGGRGGDTPFESDTVDFSYPYKLYIGVFRGGRCPSLVLHPPLFSHPPAWRGCKKLSFYISSFQRHSPFLFDVMKKIIIVLTYIPSPPSTTVFDVYPP